jgi:hypothetical protein
MWWDAGFIRTPKQGEKSKVESAGKHRDDLLRRN